MLWNCFFSLSIFYVAMDTIYINSYDFFFFCRQWIQLIKWKDCSRTWVTLLDLHLYQLMRRAISPVTASFTQPKVSDRKLKYLLQSLWRKSSLCTVLRILWSSKIEEARKINFLTKSYRDSNRHVTVLKSVFHPCDVSMNILVLLVYFRSVCMLESNMSFHVCLKFSMYVSVGYVYLN